MADRFSTEAPPSISSLVGGIIEDAQQLIRQEVALARREIKEELNKAKVAAISIAIGAGVLAIAGLMLCFTVVHLLQWLTALPLWACFGIVALLFATTGVVCFLVARNKVTDIDLVPRQTVETMKENVQWIKNQT
jgi:hypothetical protein